MSRKQLQKPSRRKAPIDHDTEWIGGHFPTPFHVTAEGTPCRPSMVVWVEAPSGLVVGHEICAPGDEREAVRLALASALWRPLAGPARRPGALRVADEALAAEVRAVAGEEIPVTVAATPELEPVRDDLERAAENGLLANPAGDVSLDQLSYLEQGRVSPASVADLFRAAGLLATAVPWSAGGEDELIRVDIPQFGVEGACLVIPGAALESRGFLLFPSLEAYDEFASLACCGGLDLIEPGAWWYSFS